MNLLEAAFEIHKNGSYNPSASAERVRFDIRYVIEANNVMLEAASPQGFLEGKTVSEVYELSPDDGMWHLRVRYGHNIFTVQFKDNSGEKFTAGFGKLYRVLFGGIVEKHALEGKRA